MMKYRSIFFGILLCLCASMQGQQSPASADVPGLPSPLLQTASPSPIAPSQQTQEGKESWTALSLADSGVNTSATGAVVLGHYETPEYTRELLQVEWRKGDPIDLYVIRPRAAARPRAILYLYNYTSDTDRFRDDGWCRRATAHGFAAVGFVSALSGQRFHSPRPLKQWFVSQLQEALATSTHDVQMVLNYLATRADLDLTRVGIFGQDSGGAIALLAASVDPRITAIDVIDPWGDWPDWLRDSRQIPNDERSHYLAPEFLRQVSNLDPVTYLPQLLLPALRVQQVLDDPITPPAARDRIAASLPRRDELVRYPTQMDQVRAWRISGLSGWLEDHLKP